LLFCKSDFGEGASSTGISITREQQQSVSYDFINLWLNFTLKRNCQAFEVFSDSLNASPRIAAKQFCLFDSAPLIVDSGNNLTSSISGMSYQWYLNGNPIVGSDSISIMVSQNGTYKVDVVYPNGCIKTSADFVLNNVGINSIKTSEFSIYPNPGTGLFKINGIELNGKNIQIQNLNGKLIYDFTIEKNNYINLENLNSGFYIIHINEKKTKVLLVK
jgi:hypothetical protein